MASKVKKKNQEVKKKDWEVKGKGIFLKGTNQKIGELTGRGTECIGVPPWPGGLTIIANNIPEMRDTQRELCESDF